MSAGLSCSKQEGCIDPNASNYVYEAQKNDGSCLYDMSFYMHSGKHLPVTIWVNGVPRDTLRCAIPGWNPRCGVDTTVYDNLGRPYSCLAEVTLKPGKYDVQIRSVDGTVWEDTYTLPENCLLIHIEDVN